MSKAVGPCLDLTLLTHEEQTVLDTLLDTSAAIDMVLPKNLEDERIVEYLGISCRAISLYSRRKTQAKIIVGRLLNLVKNRPHIYKDLGYEHYETFLTKHVGERLGMSRAVLYDCKAISVSFPSLTVERAGKIGQTNLKMLARVTNEQSSRCETWLKKGESFTTDRLRAELEKDRFIEKGETEGAFLEIPCNRAQAVRWRKWIAEPKVQQFFESTHPASILMGMIESCAADVGATGE